MCSVPYSLTLPSHQQVQSQKCCIVAWIHLSSDLLRILIKSYFLRRNSFKTANCTITISKTQFQNLVIFAEFRPKLKDHIGRKCCKMKVTLKTTTDQTRNEMSLSNTENYKQSIICIWRPPKIMTRLNLEKIEISLKFCSKMPTNFITFKTFVCDTFVYYTVLGSDTDEIEPFWL